jgi:signal transduction histidine kinase
MEQRLHRAEHVEAIGRITGGMAHEFNNLLTVMVSSLELIGPAKDMEKTQQLTARALRAAERGARLIASLLTFGRQQMLQPEVVDANALLQEVLAIIKDALGDAVEIRMDLDPALRACRADRVQLEAALLNLVINARDAMPDGGTLTLATRNAEQTVSDLADNPEASAGPFVAISVQDSGSGMEDGVKAKAFEPFFSTKEVGGGSGLGLSQVLGSVRQMGGHVTIDSEPGHGTTVTLFLPEAAT